MNGINRRSFLKRMTLLGVGIVFGEGAFWNLIKGIPKLALAETMKPDIVSVKGKSYFDNTFKAVEPFGGMKSFVSRGDRVGLLVNSPFKNVGASVNPDVTLAVIRMCYDAGAKEIRYLKDPYKGYWKRTALAEKYAAEIKSLKFESGEQVEMGIKDGLALKKAKINKDLMDCDVFINVSKTKHHEGVHMTGTLKNMMGLCPFSTNIRFHLGSLKKLSLFYSNVDHLSQCIADLNLIRKPDLCLSDATVFLSEKGPSGPGKLTSAETVVSSLNRVSLDAFSSRLLGHQPENILMIKKAFKHGLGEMDLKKMQIKEIAV